MQKNEIVKINKDELMKWEIRDKPPGFIGVAIGGSFIGNICCQNSREEVIPTTKSKSLIPPLGLSLKIIK
jgi:hypothetical protein